MRNIKSYMQTQTCYRGGDILDNKNKNIRSTSIVLSSSYFQITQGNTLAIPFTYSISVVSLQLKHSSGITVNSASLTNQTAYFNIDNIEPGFYRDCYLYDSTNNNMSYYSFDEKELVKNIISLGPYVKVIEPQYIVERIKDILTLQHDMFQ